MGVVNIEDIKKVLYEGGFLNNDTINTLKLNDKFKEDLGLDSLDIVDMDLSVMSYKSNSWEIEYEDIKTVNDYLKAVNNESRS